MKKIECPSCAMEIDSGSEECPICGYEFPRKSRSYIWVAVVLILLFVLFFIL